MPLRPRVPRRGRPLIAAAALAGVALLVAAAPATAAMFTDAAGRRVNLPDRVARILPAERNAEVLVYALAPDKLVGLERLSGGNGKPQGVERLPVLRFQQDGTADSVARAALAYRADVVIDAGPVTPERAVFADAVQQQSGIPYILVYDGFDRLQQVFSSLGALFDASERGHDLRLFFEFDITRVRGVQQIQPTDSRPHVYYALGPDGLTTALPGSPAGAAIDAAGGINVAGALGRGTLARISREQLMAWDPTIIIASDPRFLAALRRDRAWRGLAAVREKKVYLEPNRPFGWLSDPPGINRLIGLYWLSTLFYGFPAHEDLRGVTCEFYDKFYRIRLTNAQLNNLLAPAGIPRPEPPRPVGQPPAPAAGTIPGLPEAASPGSVPTIPGTETGIPGGPLAMPTPAFADQSDALCTIPGIAAPFTDLTGTIPGSSGVPAPLPDTQVAPGGRLRQPGAGGLPDAAPPGGLPPGPGR